MYIMIEDPENPGRRLYADPIVTTATSGAHTSILSIAVTDVATESTLAAAIADDLRNTDIPATCRLSDIITEYYRVWGMHDGLLQAVEEIRDMELMTPPPLERRE